MKKKISKKEHDRITDELIADEANIVIDDTNWTEEDEEQYWIDHQNENYY